jgi:glycyl-tRNA synthetase beta chain
MKMVPFLWEIGCEEIPASWLPTLIAELPERFEKELAEIGLSTSKIASSGTLRRLVLSVERLPRRQEDRVEQVTGPPLRIAKDESGNWSKAALGFARKNDVDPKALSVLTTSKGDYVGFERSIEGLDTFELLPRIMMRTLRGLSFPKFMNWDATLDDDKGAFPFGRPIRWMVALLGTKVVPFSIHVVGSPPVASGRKSRGHRFLAPKGRRPGAPFAVSSFRDLREKLKKHYVILDPDERRNRLERELAKLEKRAGAKRAPGLSVDVVGELVEWPGAVLGSYPEEFLELPEEVRHTVLIHHQHYFPLSRKPSFIAVTNMPADPKGFMRQGAERVVVARLRDAKFFWEEDLQKPLSSRLEQLEGVTFHEKLGSYRLKTERVVPLAAWVASRSGAREAPVRRAAELAKCDLVTGMVGEFPELQGIMGGLYAREQGEPESVWQAIYSHYQPLGLADDEAFPKNREGAVVSLADKLDTLAGMFSAGIVPTGSRDPFGLRRAALGTIRLLLESETRLDMALDLPPEELLAKALEIVAAQRGAVDEQAGRALREFFLERLRYVFSRRYRYDEINAVLTEGALGRPVRDLEKRLAALYTLRGSEDFEALSAAFKRVGNILAGQAPSTVDPEALFEKEEIALYQAVVAAEPEAKRRIEKAHYEEALVLLSPMRAQVDRFFDEVMVMTEDESLRRNRLALLSRLRDLFSGVADLSQIVAGEDS